MIVRLFFYVVFVFISSVSSWSLIYDNNQRLMDCIRCYGFYKNLGTDNAINEVAEVFKCKKHEKQQTLKLLNTKINKVDLFIHQSINLDVFKNNLNNNVLTSMLNAYAIKTAEDIFEWFNMAVYILHLDKNKNFHDFYNRYRNDIGYVSQNLCDLFKRKKEFLSRVESYRAENTFEDKISFETFLATLNKHEIIACQKTIDIFGSFVYLMKYGYIPNYLKKILRDLNEEQKKFEFYERLNKEIQEISFFIDDLAYILGKEKEIYDLYLENSQSRE